MGDHISTSPFSTPYHDSNSRPANNLPMLYYGLVVVGTAAIVLAIYNVIIIRWCAQEQPPRGGLVGLRPSPLRPSSLHSCDTAVLSSFKYKKGGGGVDVEQGGEEYECPVCLSVFEEGEEVRQLPRCHHSFHAPCIDMWLYSHSDCPLCRTPARARPSCRPDRAPLDTESENSREGLLGSGMPGSQVPNM